MSEEININDNLELGIWSLILQADLVVRIVMLLLLFLSVVSWSIIFEKLSKLRKLNKQANKFEKTFWSGLNIETIQDNIGVSPSHPMEAVFITGMKELNISNSVKLKNTASNQILEKRIEKVMVSTFNKELDNLEKSVNFLATTGSAAPFIGLFGTVWGIMNSFQSIATAKNTSIAIVAPGIAEALLATAMGLLAAIPAVIAYNKISSDINRYSTRLEIFLSDFNTILSRQISKK